MCLVCALAVCGGAFGLEHGARPWKLERELGAEASIAGTLEPCTERAVCACVCLWVARLQGKQSKAFECNR